MDEPTRKQLERGQRAVEILKQAQYAPLSVAEIAVSLFLIQKEYLIDVELHKVVDFEAALHKFIHDKYQNILDEINKNPVYSDEIEQKLNSIIEEFKKTQTW